MGRNSIARHLTYRSIPVAARVVWRNALRLLRPTIYGQNANLAGIIDGLNGLESRTLGCNKRRLIESEPLAVDGKTFLLDWTYNARGDVAGLIYPSAHSVGFDPNAYGEPRQVRNLPSGTQYAKSATYNPYGAIASFIYGSTATRTFTPNLRGLPAQILDRAGSTRRLDHTLSYDQNANLASIVDSLDGMETRSLGYDARNRLTSITGTPGSIGNESFTYDPLDNVRRAVGGGADRRFHYNTSTLRLSQITTVGSPNVMDYAWNDRGELSSRTHTEPGSPPVGPDVIFLNGFDEATISSTETFAFDQASRLVTAFGQMTHTYDAHNHRVSTVTLMTGTRYQVYGRDGELLYIEDSGSNQRTEFFHLNGTLVAERTRPLATESPVVSYLHSDHRGTPTVKTDSNSVVNYRSRLMPYGAPYDNNWREGPGFAKHAIDEVAQLSYMQQRYYDPVTMRFLSPDPIAAGVDSFNVYAYANNNPYTFVDPDGRESACWATGIGCGQVEITPEIAAKQANTILAMGGVALGAAILGPVIAAIGVEMSTYGAAAIGSRPEALALAGIITLDAIVVTSSGGMAPSPASSFAPGPYAAASIEARSTSQVFTTAERTAINEIGAATGCHTCGSTLAGTRSGNFVPDHQPVSRLNTANAPQRLYPHCIKCSRQQGLDVARQLKEDKKK